jgi:hypothetical protein
MGMGLGMDGKGRDEKVEESVREREPEREWGALVVRA